MASLPTDRYGESDRATAAEARPEGCSVCASNTTAGPAGPLEVRIRACGKDSPLDHMAAHLAGLGQARLRSVEPGSHAWWIFCEGSRVALR